jgi:hypothetical protein
MSLQLSPSALILSRRCIRDARGYSIFSGSKSSQPDQDNRDIGASGVPADRETLALPILALVQRVDSGFVLFGPSVYQHPIWLYAPVSGDDDWNISPLEVSIRLTRWTSIAAKCSKSGSIAENAM